MELEKLKVKIRDITIDGMLKKYEVEIVDNTMIINKKIPVQEFVYLRKNIKKLEQIDNVIVDAEV